MKIPVNQILPNPEQPRENFDQASLEELAASIREVGIIQPITVEISEDGQTYILHDGERRWRAAKLANLTEIPAEIVSPLPAGEGAGGEGDISRQRLTRALVANVQRQDLSPLEVARAYQRLRDLGLTDTQIAAKVGKSRSSVTNARRLLELPQEVQALAGQNGVSERQLTALLPLYQQLPGETLAAAEKGYGWSRPSHLLHRIQTGQLRSSDEIRDSVSSIIRGTTTELGGDFPIDQEFDCSGLRSPRCDVCPVLVKSGRDELRCPDHACYDSKKQTYIAAALASASEASSIPIIEREPRYSQVERFYSDGNLVKQILEAGCPNGNLRLELGDSNSDTPYYAHPAGHPRARVVCYHGHGKSCACLAKLRTERTRNDPAHLAEQQRKKELAKMVAEYTTVLAAAIAEGNPGAWLRILQAISYHYKDKGDGWDLDTIRRKMADALIDNRIPYDGHNRLEVARKAVDDFFAGMGLPLPGRQDPAADLRRRLDRLQGWIAALDGQEVTPNQVDGNYANALKILDELEALNLDDAAMEPWRREIAGVLELLDTLQRGLRASVSPLQGDVGAQTV